MGHYTNQSSFSFFIIINNNITNTSDIALYPFLRYIDTSVVNESIYC